MTAVANVNSSSSYHPELDPLATIQGEPYLQSIESMTSTIVLMGATGAGKSTFINLASGSSMHVGYGLGSCTSDVQIAPPFIIDGKMVTLIDTPGFDDTVKSEAEILRMIADFLTVTYEQGRKINGIIFLHRISDYRMGGVARKNFRLFRKLCGDDTLKNVVIATNMWGEVKPDIGEAREAELVSSELFFKPALEKGAQMARHHNTVESAHDIIRRIMGFPPEALQIQKETVEQGKSLAQTDAGRDLQAELELQAAKHREEMQGLRIEMEELMSAKDSKRAEELQELNEALTQVRSQLEKVQGESSKIRDEYEISKRENATKMRAMLEEMRIREEELRILQQATMEQNKKMKETMKEKEAKLQALQEQEEVRSRKMEEMAQALREAERKAEEQKRQLKEAHEKLTASISAQRPAEARWQKVRAEFRQNPDVVKREAARERQIAQLRAAQQHGDKSSGCLLQ